MIAIRRILVLCEGNHCRSPLAEALLREMSESRVEVSSAGLGALVGSPAHAEVQRILKEQGLDISNHRGRQITSEMARSADLILVMDLAQKEFCHRLAPTSRGKVFLLGHWLPPHQREIEDPMGRISEAHARVYEHVRCAVQAWLTRLLPENRQ